MTEEEKVAEVVNTTVDTSIVVDAAPISTEEAPKEVADASVADASVADNEVPKEADTATVEKKPEEDVRVRNLRMIARAKEKLERENQMIKAEKAEMARELEVHKAAKKRRDELNEEDDFSDTSVSTAANNSALEVKIGLIQQQNRQLLNQMAMDKAETKISAKYVDFADVVNDTNVSILKELDPELAAKITAEPDIYKKGVKAYDAIRKHNIYQAANEVASNKEAIIKNLAKPKPTNSSPKAGTESASVFADLNSRDYQNQLRRELEESQERL